LDFSEYKILTLREEINLTETYVRGCHKAFSGCLLDWMLCFPKFICWSPNSPCGCFRRCQDFER
jgi:hypothetical protein